MRTMIGAVGPGRACRISLGRHEFIHRGAWEYLAWLQFNTVGNLVRVALYNCAWLERMNREKWYRTPTIMWGYRECWGFI